ncbi:hypothetical protein FRC07_014385 [Ceratobasidium sp. 392]|nr:hypothetical protein FRC07_014385 [Ceratobasidium sp. 392]
MSADPRTTSQQPEDNSAGRRQSGRNRKPTQKIAELSQRSVEEEQAREAKAEAAALRAEKRPRDYSISELEALIAEKRQRTDASATKSPAEGGTSLATPQHPAPPLPSLHHQSGVNHSYVNRMRESHLSNRDTPQAGTTSGATESPNPPQRALCVTPARSICRVTSTADDRQFSSPSTNSPYMRGIELDSQMPVLIISDESTTYTRASTPQPRPLGPKRVENPAVSTQLRYSALGVFDASGAHSHRSLSPPINHQLDREAQLGLDSSPCLPHRFTTTPSPSTSSSPFVVPQDLPTINQHDDPKSKTYGDGDGELLLPRRLVLRQLGDLKDKSRKEKKQARNLLRAKASDYDSIENGILQAATRDVALGEECWDWARQARKKRITHDKGIITLLKRNVANQRTYFSNVAAELVKEHYGFKSSAAIPQSEAGRFNSDLANTLLSNESFIFKNVTTREDPYCNSLIETLFIRTWFGNHRSPGVAHPEIFFPITLTALAFILTLLEKAIREWIGGVRKPTALDGDFHRKRVYEHSQAIKRYRDYPGVKDIFDTIIDDLERAARRESQRVAPPVVEIDDDENSENKENLRGGLNLADIQRALRKHQMKRESDDNKVPVLLSACTSTRAESPGMLPETSTHQRSVDINAFGLNQSSELAPPFPENENDAWSNFSLGTTQSSFTTIFPSDSVSQQIPVIHAPDFERMQDFALGGEPQPVGFLEQLRRTF